MREELDKTREAYRELLKENQRLKELIDGDASSSIEADKVTLLKESLTCMKTAEEALMKKLEDSEKKNAEIRAKLQKYADVIRDYEKTDHLMRNKINACDERIKRLQVLQRFEYYPSIKIRITPSRSNYILRSKNTFYIDRRVVTDKTFEQNPPQDC